VVQIRIALRPVWIVGSSYEYEDQFGIAHGHGNRDRWRKALGW
jgi:hypothetical protein